MSQNPAIRAYCRQAGKALEVSGGEKRRLLDGLRQELAERFPAGEPLTLEALCEEAGSPEDAAEALLSGASEKGRARFRAGRKLRFRCAVAAVVVLLVVIAGMLAFFEYFKQGLVDHVEATVIEYKVVEVER